MTGFLYFVPSILSRIVAWSRDKLEAYLYNIYGHQTWQDVDEDLPLLVLSIT